MGVSFLWDIMFNSPLAWLGQKISLVDGLVSDITALFFYVIFLVFVGGGILNEIESLKKDDQKPLWMNMKFILGSGYVFQYERSKILKKQLLSHLKSRLIVLKSEKDGIGLFAICITILIYMFTIPYKEHLVELLIILICIIIVMRIYKKIAIEISIIEEILDYKSKNGQKYSKGIEKKRWS